MSAVSENKNTEKNQEMIDEKDEMMPEMPICVDISCDEEKEEVDQEEMILEEKPSNPEKESEKNLNSENDKALIIKISGISANSSSSAAGKKNKINPKLTQNIRKQKNKKGVKSTKCNICRKSKDLISCKKCPKSFHVACLQIPQENLPKMFLCPKCKDKVRIQKKKYREKLLKKKQSLQQQNQTEPSTTIIKEKVPAVKTAPKNGEKADKAKNDKRKKFEEFSKKYPKFVVDGRVKYPIDDKLLQLYGSLFNDVTKSTLYSSTTVKNNSKLKPSPKSCLIPSEILGDILQITNFFHTFADFFEKSSFSKEELYTALNYNGDSVLEMVNELHMDLLNIILRELFEKNKFEEFKENNPDSTSFMFLLKVIRDLRNFDDIFYLCWTEVLAQLPNLGHKFEITESVSNLFKKIGDATYLNYNKHSKEDKIKVLLALIDIIYETDVFREIIDKKMEEYNSLYKEKNDLQLEIKQDENSLHEMEAQIKELENLSSQIKNNTTTSRQEVLKKMKENENELKELTKLQSNQTKMTQQIAKKKNRFDKIQKELPFFMNSMVCLGQDVNKTEYWFLMTEDDKIFMRYPPSQKEDELERWYILDTKDEVEQLLAALNTKGIKEKALHDNINFYLKHGFLNALTEAEKTEQNKANMNENSTTSPKDNSEKLSEILATLITSQNPAEMKPERNTRGRPKKVQPQQKRHTLTMDLIINKLLQTETYFNSYLTQRSSRWILEEDKGQFLDELKNTKDLKRMLDILNYMNDNFCNIEYLYYEEDEEGSQQENQDEDEEKDENDDDEMYYSLRKKGKKTIDLENDGKLVCKKINLRIWGFYNEKTRKSWIHYVTSVADNMAALYVATIVFCDYISKYVSKKMIELESNYDKSNKNQEKKMMNFESYKYVSNNELNRAKQEKMNELLNNSDYMGVSTRRTTRKHMLVKNKVSNDKGFEWEEDCRECGEGGEVLCCDTCPSVFHLKCVGLKEVPEGKWSCTECLQKLQTQRHTRAISKKFNIDDM